MVMPILVVDFNMIKNGRLPARIRTFDAFHDPLRVGQRVRLTDGEGTTCKATIEEVLPTLVMVRPESGSFRSS